MAALMRSRLKRMASRQICESVSAFADALQPNDTVMALMVTRQHLNIAMSDLFREHAAPFGLIHRVSAEKDRNLLLSALQQAKTRPDGDITIGGLVVALDVGADGAVDEQAQKVIKYADEVVSRLAFPHVRGVLYWHEAVAFADALRAYEDFVGAANDTGVMYSGTAERRLLKWDRAAPRLSPEKYCTPRKDESARMWLSAADVLQSVLDEMVRVTAKQRLDTAEQASVHERSKADGQLNT